MYKIGRYEKVYSKEGFEMGYKIIPIISNAYENYEEAKRKAFDISNIIYIKQLEERKQIIIDMFNERIEGAKEGVRKSYWSREHDEEYMFHWDSVRDFGKDELIDGTIVIYTNEDEKSSNEFNYSIKVAQSYFTKYKDLIK